ncbi:hypothetical protein IHE45_19G104200 [Dioscorea alata]|uniref:Uncharacterized protein n=1 Tax=Dioscorea alata TaxID=55571 RepID=A0ACB7U0G5_DIOAL|nr:hypothetical protein IHE45_19G104200 [Dioscorea alata]
MVTLSFNCNPFKNKQQNPDHLLPCRSSSKTTSIRSSVSFRSPAPPGPGEDKKEKAEDEENKGVEKKMKKKGLSLVQHIIYGEVEKLGKGLKECLSPKQKGDWKDVFLMSFSFAVYVYISQKIVCAYCAWTAMH